MRSSTHVALVVLALLTESANALAQTPPAPAPAPAAPPPAAPAATPPATTAPAEAAPAPAAPAAAPAAAATPAPAAPTTSILDKISADAFVDAYYAFNANQPKPQGPVPPTSLSPPGGNQFRAFDYAQGFALNQLGANATYATDTIGGTIALRFGPSTMHYASGQDLAYGLQYVRQAYGTLKLGKVTMDLGKWDQPYGSEVPDSQLNLEYSRSLLFTFAQPLYFTGLRVDYAVSDSVDAKIFVANGWNNSIAINRTPTVGAQLMYKPADIIVFYLGDVIGPQQQDWSLGTMGTKVTVADVPDANSHFRNLADLVVDFNPTSTLRLLANADYVSEASVPIAMGGSQTEAAYGVNLAIKYAFSDAFYANVRGEYFHDEYGNTGAPAGNTESGTLTLGYTYGTKLTFMLEGRYDVNENSVFQKNATETAKDQFTAMLGVIASTK
jgi:hypothetical protein